MGLKNHLLVVDVTTSGDHFEIDIEFTFGEAREYFYRIGDEIYFRADDIGSERSAVVCGLALVGDISLDITNLQERYFRIIIVNGVIVSYFPTTQADYEQMESNSAG